MTYEDGWVSEVGADFRQRLRNRRVLFVHLGALHGTYFRTIVDELESVLILSADEVCSTSIGMLTDRLADAGTFIVSGVESLAATERSRSLGALREAVNTATALDVKVCLISAVSRNLYPSVPGSSIILLDSFPYSLPLCVAASDDLHGLSRLPAYREASDLDFRAVFGQALRELSVNTLLEVERVVCELSLSAKDMPSALESGPATELIFAGLLYREPIDQGVVFSVSSRYTNFRLAICDVMATVTTPPTWLARVYDDLFIIERWLRARVRATAMDASKDKWRRGLLESAVELEVLRRASHWQHVGSVIESVRDPLEWLTLDELLTLIMSKKMKCLGVDESLWIRFRNEVIPIRNRVGHMRLVSEQHAKTIRHWKGVVTSLQ